VYAPRAISGNWYTHSVQSNCHRGCGNFVTNIMTCVFDPVTLICNHSAHSSQSWPSYFYIGNGMWGAPELNGCGRVRGNHGANNPLWRP
jgi:hypothetical protein